MDEEKGHNHKKASCPATKNKLSKLPCIFFLFIALKSF